MRYTFYIFMLLLAGKMATAQKVDSIYFHLYTDSLKKGRHNYINVDGKLPNGRWLPLTEKEVIFSSDKGHFEGNELVLPAELPDLKVTVSAVLRSAPAIHIERTIWIKQMPEPDLPAQPGGPAPKKNKRT